MIAILQSNHAFDRELNIVRAGHQRGLKCNQRGVSKACGVISSSHKSRHNINSGCNDHLGKHRGDLGHCLLGGRLVQELSLFPDVSNWGRHRFWADRHAPKPVCESSEGLQRRAGPALPCGSIRELHHLRDLHVHAGHYKHREIRGRLLSTKVLVGHDPKQNPTSDRLRLVFPSSFTTTYFFPQHDHRGALLHRVFSLQSFVLQQRWLLADFNRLDILPMFDHHDVRQPPALAGGEEAAHQTFEARNGR